MPSHPVHITYRRHYLFCDSNTEQEAGALMMHGGGIASNLALNFLLRSDLYNVGISTVAFDFLGHGKSVGDLTESNLKDRTEQACAVISSQKIKKPLTVIGASMSAYTALKLTEHFQVEKLILFVPAAYTPRAYKARFKDEFSKIIREPNSWQDSDAWGIIEKFEGSLLFIVAGQDEVVPREIPDRLYGSAKKAKRKHWHLVESSPHKILTYLKDAHFERSEIVDLIKNI